MIRVLQLNVFFLVLFLFLFGCSEHKKDEGGMSASSQIKDPADLIKLAVSKQVTGTYDEAIDILDQAPEIQEDGRAHV